jgi:hypothetical protein
VYIHRRCLLSHFHVIFIIATPIVNVQYDWHKQLE